MATAVKTKKDANDTKVLNLLKSARKRATLPETACTVDYQKDVDLLFIRFSNQKPAQSKFDAENDVIYNLNKKRQIISVEIMDFKGIYI